MSLCDTDNSLSLSLLHSLFGSVATGSYVERRTNYHDSQAADTRDPLRSLILFSVNNFEDLFTTLIQLIPRNRQAEEVAAAFLIEVSRTKLAEGKEGKVEY